MKWERREVDSNTGESIGRCESEHPIAYVLPLVFILLLPTCLTAWFAYKTKDVDDRRELVDIRHGLGAN